MALEDFDLPFEGFLDADNRWVQMSGYVPWEMVEEIYASAFKNERPDGKKPINARIAFGALFIKGHGNLTDEATVQHIAENPYMQFFLGQKRFESKPLFDASMMTHFRKRFSAKDIKRINEEMYFKMHKDQNDNDKGNGRGGKDEEPPNKGNLVLDATVAPSDIRYPTDLSLLNEGRENCEEMLDILWPQIAHRGHKTPYTRKKARKSYLAVAKQRKPRRKSLQKAIGEQLDYLCKALDAIDNMLGQTGEEALPPRKRERLKVLRQLYNQQSEMHESGVKRCDDRIVSLRQPHVRPIKRGKAGRDTEFGQKLAFAVVDGFTFIEEQSWDNFSEGATLIDSAQRYRERHGAYPKAILADMAYRTRKNLAFCKQHGIRLSGPRLGRPRADEWEADRQQAYQDSCDRNIVEGRNGIAKRRFGLDLVMAYLADSAQTEATLVVFAMNVSHLMRIFWLTLRHRFFCLLPFSFCKFNPVFQ